MKNWILIVLMSALILLTQSTVKAANVVYRFSGELSGYCGSVLSPIDLINTPFTIDIYGDTENAGYLGKVAGAGSLYANKSTEAVWTIDGFGEALADAAQVYTLPGIGRIGIGWDGEVFPFTTENPAKRRFEFLGPIATDPSYYGLNSVVDEISLNLLTNLENPPNVIPKYTTSIYFDDVGMSVILEEITNVSYSVEPVPIPGAAWLLGSGLIGLLGFRRKMKNRRQRTDDRAEDGGPRDFIVPAFLSNKQILLRHGGRIS